MYVIGSLLKQAIFENKELTRKLIKEITNEDISKVKESNLKFGYGYYKPVLFLECENDNNENIYLAFQEIYEPVMMKGTIAEFLMNKNKSKIFNKEIVICFNFDKQENNSVELIEKKSYDRKIVFNINIFKLKNEESILNDFCIMIQEPLDERVLNSNYEILKDIAFKISAEMNKDKMKLLDLEKGFRDRKNIMGVESNRENALFNKAVELYCKTEYSKEFLYDLFNVFSKEDFNYYLDLFKQDYENALKLLEKGVEKKLIIDEFNISELILYFAEESFKNKK